MKKSIPLLLSMTLLLSICLLPVFSTAETFRDDVIDINIPDSFEYEENYSDETSNCQCIFDAYDESFRFSLYYTIEGDYAEEEWEASYDMTNKEDALQMYEDEGADVISNLVYEMAGVEALTLDSEEYFRTAQGGFVKARIRSEEGFDGVAYIAKADTEVYEVFVGSNLYEYETKLSTKNLHDADAMVQSFDDIGYYETFAVNYHEGGSDIGIGLLGIILVSIVIVIKAVNRNKGSDERRERSPKKVVFDGKSKGATLKDLMDKGTKKIADELSKLSDDDTIVKKKDVFTEEWEDDDYVTEKTEFDGQTRVVSHCTYEDSLRTLYHSGLITKSEMNQMLSKHRN